MTTNSRQNLEKTVIRQDLKFSVEFENGETSSEREIDESNASKDVELEEFQENTRKSEHVKSERVTNESDKNKTKSNNKRNDEEAREKSTEPKIVTKKARTDAESGNAHTTVRGPNVKETKGTGDRSQRAHRSSFEGAKHKPLPNIGKTESGGVRQRSEKAGDPGEIPIQARIRGPGPAYYLLPTTIGRGNVDATKRHSPAFSFGSRSWSFRNDSPGPAYKFDPLLGPKGKENRPSYSFGTRPKTPVQKFVTPGPGAYNTDSPPLWEKRAPQYSISPRTKQRSVDVVPGPNNYLLPSTLGDRVPHQRGAPAITMFGRSEKRGYAEDLAKTPGPAKYGASSPSVTKRRGPEYSVQGRSFFNGNKNTVPGPGAYSPPNVNSYLEQSPRHVIATKHSEFVMPTLTIADCD